MILRSIPVLCLLFAVSLLHAADPIAKPTTVVPFKDCVTSQCHTSVKDFKQVHGPVNVNACDACHTLEDASKHTFKHARTPEQTCTFCHQMELSNAKVIHKPLKEGQCMNCHNPHGGFDRNMLRSKSMGDLCKTCHQDPTANHSSIHGPVAAGACGACHQPHTSNNEHLLVKTGKELCLSCHQEMGKQLKDTRFMHKPVAENQCTTCHDAHASDSPGVLKGEPLKLCTTECHQDIRKAAFEAKHKHQAVIEDRACVNCHTAHGGDLAKLMKSKPIDICLKCHDKSIRLDDGKTIAAVNDISKDGMSLHGPLREGTCGGCHNVHGSDYTRLLTQEYPESFYAGFKVESYGLCFTCHDKQLALTKETDKLTGFRNGQQNLHFLHVNKDTRGRTCRACHSTHASTQDMHVRESVPYGQWQLPVSFTPNANGGSCTPGCHQSYAYDRKTPVNYDAPSTPAAPPATPAAPAATETKTP